MAPTVAALHVRRDGLWAHAGPCAARYLPGRMAIGFVIIVVFVGLVVFFIALGGGPRRARGALYTSGRGARRLVTVLALVMGTFAIAVPALVLAFNGDHKASVSVSGIRLTAAQQHGRDLFARACAVCHTLRGAAAVGRVGPNLDI